MAIDKSGTGMIDADDLKGLLQRKNFDLKDQSIDNLIEQCNYNGNNNINYSDFLSATIKIKDFIDEEKLLAIFN